MTVKEIAYKIEELQIAAEKVNSLQNALFSAIFDGNYAPETYEWAFVALGDITHALKNELNDVTKELFNIMRVERKEIA